MWFLPETRLFALEALSEQLLTVSLCLLKRAFLASVILPNMA